MKLDESDGESSGDQTEDDPSCSESVSGSGSESGSKKHECDQCGAAFGLKTTLTRHMKIHSRTKRSFGCSVCKHVFSDRKGLKTHMRAHSGILTRVWSVTNALTTTTSWSAQSQHKPYSCPDCNMTFLRKHFYEQHLRVHQAQRRSRVWFVTKRGRTLQLFRVWESLSPPWSPDQTPDRPPRESFQLFSLQQDLSLQSYLDLHMMQHTDTRAFSCPECNKRFTLKVSLQKHMTPADPRRAATVQLRRLSQELRPAGEPPDAHADPLRPQTFQLLGLREGLQRGYTLKLHEASHSDARPFSCSQCGNDYKRKSHLSEHMKSHLGFKPFSCSHCGKTFTTTALLKSHVTVHEGGRPFSCSVCGKGFMGRTQLEIHNRFHTGEKPYRCSVCDKDFAREGAWKIHELTHKKKKKKKQEERKQRLSDRRRKLHRKSDVWSFILFISKFLVLDTFDSGAIEKRIRWLQQVLGSTSSSSSRSHESPGSNLDQTRTKPGPNQDQTWTKAELNQD
ncbi:hypothetical protein WMY93_033587 [Mugilogobius chulae]|uniref:C2H2-type domain-containing protein n=1 Tax=Mugilogobius chulae TaxID=88201 RepID=A0AAW0MKR2_9GOBI